MTFFRSVFLCFFLWAHLQTAFATPSGPLLLTGQTEQVEATPWMHVSVSPANHYKTALKSQWQPAHTLFPTLSDGPIWTRLTLKNTSERTQTFMAIYPRASIENLRVYVLDHNQRLRKTHQVGALSDPSLRPVIHRKSMVPVTFQPDETLTLLTRIHSSGLIMPTWDIQSIHHFGYQSAQATLGWGVFIGALIILIIFHLNYFFQFRERYLLAYLSLAGFSGLSLLSEFGIFQNLFAHAFLSKWLPLLNGISHLLALISLVMFHRYFFRTQTQLPKLHPLLTGLIWLLSISAYLYLAATLLLDTPHNAIEISLLFVTLLVFFITTLVALSAYKQRLTGAQALMWHQLIFAVAIAWSGARYTELVSMLGWDWPVFAALFVLAMLMLAIGIGQKLTLSQRQKEKRQHLLYTQSRLANIGQTFSTITHQAKLPVARLGSQIGLMQTLIHKHPEGFQQRLQQILPGMREQLTLLNQTVEDFKRFYKAPADTQTMQPEAVTEQVMSLLSGKAALTHTRMKVTTHPNDLTLKLDIHALRHVIMVLLDNALDMLKERRIENTQIHCHFLAEKKGTLLTVTDQAGGIRIKPISRIFEHFVSEKSDLSTGMGLSIAKLLVEERLGGHIDAHNIHGGAQFTVWLPDQAPGNQPGSMA